MKETTENKMKKADEEFFKFLQAILQGINSQPAQPSHHITSNTNITIVVNEPKRGWLRRQFLKLW